MGGKAVPCTVPAFDMGAIVSLNSISTKQAGFERYERISLSNEMLQTKRPSKGGSLVALSHPFVYLCRLTSGGNCRCRFSVQIHMSLSLQHVIEVKSTPKRKGNKVRTKRWTDEETDIREVAKTNQKKSGQGVSENYKSGRIYWDRLQFLIPVIRAGKSKDWHKTS